MKDAAGNVGKQLENTAKDRAKDELKKIKLF
jgi:hypothetical protein